MIINFSTNIFKRQFVVLGPFGLFLYRPKGFSQRIVASIEGEVNSLNMVDDFKVEMGPTEGKKVTPKTILSTGKFWKGSVLFSNGTLITIKLEVDFISELTNSWKV